MGVLFPCAQTGVSVVLYRAETAPATTLEIADLQ